MTRPDYRPFLPTPEQSKIAGPTARAHAQARTANPRSREMAAQRKALYETAFQGIATDGTPVPGLYALAPNRDPFNQKQITAYDADRRPDPPPNNAQGEVGNPLGPGRFESCRAEIRLHDLAARPQPAARRD